MVFDLFAVAIQSATMLKVSVKMHLVVLVAILFELAKQQSEKKMASTQMVLA